MKRALSIAGSDCSGGAGIQADLKTFSAHGVFGMSVIVSVVAENTEKVIDVQDISEDMIKKQIEAVFEDIGVDAVKIGMLSNPQCMKTVAEQMKHYKPLHIVVDPVMYAKNGCPLMDPREVYEELGIDISSLTGKKLISKKRKEQKDFYDVWIVYGEFGLHELSPNKTEVIDVKWMDMKEILLLNQYGYLHPLLDYVDVNFFKEEIK